MEGLIPFVLNALKKNKLHQQSYKSLSDSSRRGYHLLLSGGDSVNGSSHRRTRSEFQPPSSMGFVEYGQPESEGAFVRSQSLKKDPNVSETNTGNRVNQTRFHADHLPSRVAHQKWI